MKRNEISARMDSREKTEQCFSTAERKQLQRQNSVTTEIFFRIKEKKDI